MAQHGGGVLAKQLENFGVSHVFGVPGESYLPLLDGLLDTGLTFVNARNEGGAAFMACAWGQLTGEPGISMVTRGPGATNASIGVHTARQGSVPMILFIGQVDQDMIGREAFQEIDYHQFYGDVAKAVFEIRETARIPEIVSRAWSVAMSGRKGPVVVVLPADILNGEAQVEALGHAPFVYEAAPAAGAMREVVEALERAERPLVIYGGTSWTARGRQALENFAGARNLPVLSAFRFQDGFDNFHRSYVGDVGLGVFPFIREAVQQSDLILGINLRFGENSTDGYRLFDVPKMRQKLVHVHISADELNKIYQADIALLASPNEFCEALNAAEIKGDWREWLEPLRAQYEAQSAPPRQAGKMDMGSIMDALQAELSDDAVLTNGAGNFAIWPSKYFRFCENQRLIAPQSGAMGYGLPAAIAVKIAQPERQVICLAGDGDFQMNLSELGTAAQMDARPIILILNNGSYGTIRMHQERSFKGRVSGTNLENPDFVAIAAGYGFHAERIWETCEFAPAFGRALASETGAVLEIMTSVENITPMRTLSD